ncbi:hypothetical protein [Dactylosporangium sp. NPDC000521]|uniref:hypothetical protein n=1 Tax=Dactylosporangium sp. NPDC000521 TaxID=3363975 RepID=UPI0036A3C915
MSDSDLWPAPADLPPLPPAEAPPVSRLDRVREVLRLEGLAAAAAARAAEVRASLQDEARAEYAREKTAPSWRMPDVATVSLSISKDAIVVSDADALIAWVKERHPHQIRTVTTEQIWPGFQTQLLADCVPTGEGDQVADPKTGEVVPGVAARKGGVPKSLSITAAKGVKDAFAAYGAALLDEVLAGEVTA